VVGRGNLLCDDLVSVTFRQVLPLKDVTNQEETARDAFIDLMQAAYSQVIQRTIQVDVGGLPIDTWMPELTLLEKSINRTYPNVLVTAGVDSPTMTVIGSFELAAQLETTVKNNMKRMLYRPSGRLWRGEDDDQGDERGPVERSGDEFRYECSARDTVDGGIKEAGGSANKSVTVRLYTADITHLNVDVIVNAGNSTLENWAGVAGDIERAGGAKLREDCRTLIEREGPLKVSQSA
jgi:hypothetical protein